MAFRLGVDVGGTFTDLLLVDEESGDTFRAKTSSTPADQSVGVLRGINQVCQLAGIGLDQVGDVLHGTTVATNAVLEGKGARVGLVTTSGFRQVLQIARSFVPGGQITNPINGCPELLVFGPEWPLLLPLPVAWPLMASFG